MSLEDDVRFTAVTAASHALAPFFPDVSSERLVRAAEAAVAAAAPFLDGSEHARVTRADSGGTVTS
jgi:hypothetical protein